MANANAIREKKFSFIFDFLDLIGTLGFHFRLTFDGLNLRLKIGMRNLHLQQAFQP
jgi:hypothetical protein